MNLKNERRNINNLKNTQKRCMTLVRSLNNRVVEVPQTLDGGTKDRLE